MQFFCRYRIGFAEEGFARIFGFKFSGLGFAGFGVHGVFVLIMFRRILWYMAFQEDHAGFRRFWGPGGFSGDSGWVQEMICLSLRFSGGVFCGDVVFGVQKPFGMGIWEKAFSRFRRLLIVWIKDFGFRKL